MQFAFNIVVYQTNFKYGFSFSWDIWSIQHFFSYFGYNITNFFFNLSHFLFIKVNTSKIEHFCKQKYEPIIAFFFSGKNLFLFIFFLPKHGVSEENYVKKAKHNND